MGKNNMEKNVTRRLQGAPHSIRSIHSSTWASICTSAYLLIVLVIGVRSTAIAQPIAHEDSGAKVSLWADTDLVANPVCLAVDEKSRVFVAESFRQRKGIEDNRSHAYWLLDDLAAETTDDRLALMKKWEEKTPLDFYTKFEERITRLADTDGDGMADERTIYADGFNEPLDGTGAGLLARNGELWYTCIPKLWKLIDSDDDGVADERSVLSEGYGVRWALRGHDLHGLCWGMDGRLYFSIGDRGYHVNTKEGKLLKDGGSGAVFRCEPDGSNLEIFCTGMRNPQEMAFDNHGNLFAGDNNSDAGDRARIIYCAEGGYTGWRMEYQTLEAPYSRGPWHMDKIWHTQHVGQVAWVLPPIAHVGNGPSGFFAYPGIGLSERYDNHLFMVDFKANAANSLIHAFECTPQGAGFELVDLHPFVRNFVPTDAEFGYDGKLYISDWLEGWDGTGKGKLWTVSHPEHGQTDTIKAMQKLMAEGIEKQSDDALAELLSHPDLRVRKRAQFALAKNNRQDLFTQAYTQTENPLARLHGIWGTGQILRKSKDNSTEAKILLPLLKDNDPEVVCQTIHVLGESDCGDSIEQFRVIAKEGSNRQKYFAVIALGRMAHYDSMDVILDVLAENNNQDVFLRHGCVMGLYFMNAANELVRKSGHSHPAARVGLLLALRRHGDRRVEKFLMETDDFVMREAAIAIYDANITEAMGSLANILTRYDAESFDPFPAPDSPTVLRRAIDAAFIVGGEEQAKLLAEFASKGNASEEMRTLALNMLKQWQAPEKREPVHGFYRDFEPRDPELIKHVLEKRMATLLDAGGSIQKAALQLAGAYGFNLGDKQVLVIATDDSQPSENRLEAMNRLAEKEENQDTLRELLKDKNEAVRAGAIGHVASFDPDAITVDATKTMRNGKTLERQAVVHALANIESDEADKVLKQFMKNLINGQLDRVVHLDVLEAATKRNLSESLAAYNASIADKDKLEVYRQCLDGGDPVKGKAVFENAVSQCARCHNVSRDTHKVLMAGPDLSQIAKLQKPEYILASIMFPNDAIAKGFGSISITRKDDSSVGGILKSETDTEITLQDAENKMITINKSDIKDRTEPASGMPPMGLVIGKRAVRDLMAYMKTMK